MGANQSKTPLPNEKLLIERMRALELKDADNDFVHVDEKDVTHGSKKNFRAPWTNLSISEIEHWEHELLQDPKNRSLFLSSLVLSVFL
jgi:bleomycin hydrolase